MGRSIHGKDRSSVSALEICSLRFADASFFFVRSMHDFNQSLSYDKRMHAQDIKGSIAYARALALSGILTKEEELEVVKGLKQVDEEWASGKVSASFIPRIILDDDPR